MFNIMAVIKSRFIVEIAGKPQENVQKALERFQKEFEEGGHFYKLVDCELEEPEYSEDSKLYVGFLEVDAKFKDISELLGFIVDFTPTSIEIESPEEFNLDANDLSGVLNDMSSMLLKSNLEKQKLQKQVFDLKYPNGVKKGSSKKNVKK